ncbi:hypothetical protein [Corynebacterium sp.]|uniref:hypothetical protein n=1 Tax=Corynebacterium sp. TaxID=1720 RepID=UPI0026DD9E10|nr:hypothetical protein [Corynebacterium sp.]MDO5076366.1 hypothetical protein [Corynebacterium sp.]
MPQTLQKTCPSEALDALELVSPGIDAYAAYDAMHDALATLKAAYLRRLLHAASPSAQQHCQARLEHLERVQRGVDLADVEGLIAVARRANDELTSIGGLGGGEAR